MTETAENRVPSPLVLRLQALSGELTKSEAVIAQWLTRNEAILGLETGASIAAKTGVSEITVSRFLRRLGYKGLQALKEDLQTRGAAQLPGADAYVRLLDGETAALIRRDAEAVLAISAQVARPEWEAAVAAIHAADEVFVAGFQSVKGVAEDFARRLSIVHERVRFLTPHDSGLAEWLPSADARRCLVLVDTVPYAREAEGIVRMAAGAKMDVVVLTDELNTWATRHTPFVFFVTSAAGAFVESTGPLASLLNLVTHAVAARDPERAKARLAAWPAMLRELGLF
ncbi:MurR/RpiR family transcriptional regulator [Rhizobiaceae bacterium BDR2-2]|uniref:MurR/RpiR family transcriptional regulator n=1 Tax=Ectorhizobium quercum TaxID=2965071 RepID=A0AAE3MZ47_9HYPH|nr:MurR/RpiR family transcriptional regulator [Ectorhizobium quercum]MCX8996976.1 MurR/RpiR family transcriptional regulator [Ectorhizobium quercum]